MLEKCYKRTCLNKNEVRGQIHYLLKLLTYKRIIFMSKIVRQWLKNCTPIQFFLLLEITCEAFCPSPVKSLIIALCHLCLEMFEGKHITSILKIYV